MRAIIAPWLSALLFCILPMLALPSGTASAATPAHRAPARAATAATARMLGRYEDWTAAVHQEAGQTVCYAFTRPSNSVPSMAGRGEVVLTVAERPTGRDAVAITAGFAYPPGAEVPVQIDQTGFQFYTAQRNAFARDGAAVVAALQKGRQAVARSGGPRGVQVTDTFSLRGFTQAYNAIVKACPAPR
jgi:invasion protein IalB